MTSVVSSSAPISGVTPLASDAAVQLVLQWSQEQVQQPLD